MDDRTNKIIDSIIADLYSRGVFDFCSDLEAQEAENGCRESWERILKRYLDLPPF